MNTMNVISIVTRKILRFLLWPAHITLEFLTSTIPLSNFCPLTTYSFSGNSLFIFLQFFERPIFITPTELRYAVSRFSISQQRKVKVTSYTLTHFKFPFLFCSCCLTEKRFAMGEC